MAAPRRAVHKVASEAVDPELRPALTTRTQPTSSWGKEGVATEFCFVVLFSRRLSQNCTGK